MNDFSKEILEENIIRAIQQFHRYAPIYDIDRNNIVIDVLDELLQEANKMQLQESSIQTESQK